MEMSSRKMRWTIHEHLSLASCDPVAVCPPSVSVRWIFLARTNIPLCKAMGDSLGMLQELMRSLFICCLWFIVSSWLIMSHVRWPPSRQGDGVPMDVIHRWAGTSITWPNTSQAFIVFGYPLAFLSSRRTDRECFRHFTRSFVAHSSCPSLDWTIP
ncbi:hypothetical protein JAAARDRAFT_573090 [Jaapia argillacea MUCL 33604]|uniref:Uncharacterized protein n=1 Tax=Jaapia argillacea MUCL 33604 TaxID=933084 RepID=A0A067Q226_9AGAM|nr:hypothetical protein JAAARDRAFT_573090 [Jaapia argillacea MUCL 33604]